MTSRLPVLRVFLFVLGLLTLGGCANYQLGTGASVSFTTLYIEPVENATLVPQARALLSTQLREAFANDGRVTLVNSADAADATLRVVIRNYGRTVASVREEDTGLARKFSLNLEVACTLTDQRTDRALFTDRLVNSQRDAFTDGGQLQSEFQTLPLLAESLAKKITHAVLDIW